MRGLQPGETPSGVSLFLWINIRVMKKIFQNYEQQIKRLSEDKNLIINDKEYAIEILKRYSYYSLISGYKDRFKKPGST